MHQPSLTVSKTLCIVCEQAPWLGWGGESKKPFSITCKQAPWLG